MDLDEPGANPDVDPPTSAQVERVTNVNDPSASPPGSSTLHLDGSDNLDVAGPSTTYLPRQTSPPLPDLRYTAFPPNEHSDHSDDDEDDEVVAQLPIYLSPNLYPNLNLYQYPLLLGSLSTPTWAKERGKTISARVKEQTGRVEVEIPVDEQARFWRDDRATELGFLPNIHANGDDIEGGFGYNKTDAKKKAGKKKSIKTDKWGDKRRLRGEIIPNAPEYYSGVVHDGALHLHPISRLVQFRPTLTYLDDFEFGPSGSTQSKEDPKAKANGAKAPAVPARGKQNDQNEENDGSGSIKDFRNKMMAVAKREEEDHWVAYEWRQGDDQAVLDSLDSLLVSDDKHERLECSTTGLDYLNRQ